jgi:phosphohistidine swiveling domain-containing protein
MSGQDEDISGLRWADDHSTAFALLLAQIKAGGKEGDQVSWDHVKALLDSPKKEIVSHATPEYETALQQVKDAIQKHMKDDTEYHLEAFETAVSALRQLLHEKERIHIVYCEAGYFLRTAIGKALYQLKLVDDAHSFKETILPSHPVFSLTYDQLKSLWQQEPAIQKQMLADAVLMVRMFKGMAPPASVGSGMEHVTAGAGSMSGSAGDMAAGECLQGVGCSAGILTAKACVVKNLSEAAANLEKGGILVTTYTDPSWSPLFSLCSAVILVDGGVLSHAAVVAREMKIPCVVQIKSALQLGGKTITINGSRGTVRIIE